MDAKRAQEALMSGQARFEKWRSKFVQEWQEPGQQQQLQAYFAMLPPEAKDNLKAQDPVKYAELEKFLKKKKAG